MAQTYNEDTYIFKFTSLKDMLEEYTFTFPKKTGLVGFKHSWSLTCFNNFGEWHGSGSTSTYVSYIYKWIFPSWTEKIKVSNGDLSILFGTLHIELLNETEYSAT
ncbi:unnamed protein product, partial [marine sediment metagenome]